MERRDVGELEAHREVGQLPRRARRGVDAARRAEERAPAGVEAPRRYSATMRSAPRRVPRFAKATLQLRARAWSSPSSGPAANEHHRGFPP